MDQGAEYLKLAHDSRKNVDMKWVWTIMLFLLALLAILSGVAKVLLVPEEVSFFGKYGFSSSILIAYGATQVIGGVLLPLKKSRLIGAIVIAATFFVSLVLLILDGNVVLSAVTLAVMALLAFVMVRIRRLEAPLS